jgi:glycosyltransferase involved in cell wall biosynthesis
MKIVQVCPKYLPERSGIITHVKEVSERLAAKGHDVKVLTTDPTGRLCQKELICDVSVERYKSWAPLHLYHFSAGLLKALRKVDCDILHCHGYQDFPPIAGFLAGGDRKFLVTLHSGWPLTSVTRMLNDLYTALLGIALARADRIIFVSKSEFAYFSTRVPGMSRFPVRKLVLLPNGADRQNLQERARSEIVPRNTKYILSVSGLRKYKGQDFLIKGFAKTQFAPSEDVKLVIAGTGDYVHSLSKLIDRMKLKDRVLLLDTPDDETISWLYQNCAAFVLLSRFESQGITVAEAIAARIPTIVTLVPGLEDYVMNGYARGIPYPPEASQLARILEETIREPQKYVPKNVRILSWDDVTESLEGIYEELVTARR